MYAWFHGLPTYTAAGKGCSCNTDVVADPLLGDIKTSWKSAFLSGHENMSELIRQTECAECSKERNRRRRVLSEDDMLTTSEEFKQNPWCEAPALYSFNVPRYFTMQLRAREYAKQNNVQLSWCYARDIPLHPSDRELPLEALQAKLTAWLNRHDQETGHIASILPLAVGMPIRLTENVDRDRQMYRGRRGIIHGWTLAGDCIPEEMGSEFLLSKLPVVIYLKMEGATWTIGKLPQGVYPLRPKTRTWKVNKYTGIEARRTGFWIIPDFCSTAHMIQGATLKAAFVDAQHSSINVSVVNQIAAYVSLSRYRNWKKYVSYKPFPRYCLKEGHQRGQPC